MMNNYKNLKLWQKSVDLAVDIYGATSDFPLDEKYGITSQIRRSSVSIAANVAEGSGRNTRKDFNNFLGMSYASSCELETELIIANRVGFLSEDKFHRLTTQIEEIQKMNYALKRTLTQD